jgi:predicted metal-dependent phosphoesterase TrpH
MPAGQPFTQLCQSLARPRHFGRVDLHLHTTFSDGTYSPVEVVDLARRSGLSAIAITDHDTIDGYAPTKQLAGSAIEVVSGVEITAEWRGRELHLLGYFFDADNNALDTALTHLRSERIGRFRAMVERLKPLGVHFENEDFAHLTNRTTLGRRHLAEMLVKAKKAATVREAFHRWLGDHGRAAVPKTRLPVAEAIRLVRAAGGIAAWAHPNYDCAKDALVELGRLGLGAIEVEYPSFRSGRIKELRHLAVSLGLAVSGGSDCHGPGEPSRAIGASTISRAEFDHLRERARS